MPIIGKALSAGLRACEFIRGLTPFTRIDFRTLHKYGHLHTDAWKTYVHPIYWKRMRHNRPLNVVNQELCALVSKFGDVRQRISSAMFEVLGRVHQIPCDTAGELSSIPLWSRAKNMAIYLIVAFYNIGSAVALVLAVVAPLPVRTRHETTFEN